MSTKRLSGKQRSLYEAQASAALRFRECGLTPLEDGYYRLLLEEAGHPTNTTERLAILDRARGHVAGAAQAKKERGKSAETHRKELWG